MYIVDGTKFLIKILVTVVLESDVLQLSGTIPSEDTELISYQVTQFSWPWYMNGGVQGLTGNFR